MLLDAQFIGVIQVLVYAGAIMVVFLFVIMLLNLGRAWPIADVRGAVWPDRGRVRSRSSSSRRSWCGCRTPTPVPSLVIPAGLARGRSATRGAPSRRSPSPLFTEYLLAFEVTSVLLLAAVVGAVVIGRREAKTRQ